MEANACDMVVYSSGADKHKYRNELLTCSIDEQPTLDKQEKVLSFDTVISPSQESNLDDDSKSPKLVSFFKQDDEASQTEVDEVAESFSRLRKESSLRSSISRYRRSLKVITSKVVKADKTWVGCMIAMSSIDIFLNLANFVQMSDDNLNYGLVIGPPSRVLWYTLLVFTCISWLLFVPETLNSLSVLYSPLRETYFPIAVEMTITLLFKHIPLSTVVYFVGRCRREYTTSLESACNGFRIVHILGRLVWYAHLEGRKLRRNDKHVLQKSFVLLSLLLFGVATSFVIKNWRNEPDTRLKRYHLVNVSILMINQQAVDELFKERFPPEVKSFKLDVSHLIRRHGYHPERPYLVPSILVIKQRGNFTSDFQCNSSQPQHDLKPFECDSRTKLLRFHFVFHEPTLTSPYGEIRYNFAKVSKLAPPSNISDDTNSKNSTHKDAHKYACEETDEEPQRQWRLYYVEVRKRYSNLTQEDAIKVIVSSPFRKTWTHPRPRYDEDVPVCKSGRLTCAPEAYPLRKSMIPLRGRVVVS